jgi:hypothetical protein
MRQSIPTLLVLLSSIMVVALATPAESEAYGPIVVPSSVDTVEGNANNSLPFDLRSGLPPSCCPSQAVRYQQVFAASEFASLSAPFLITQIAFRPDAEFGSPFASVLSHVDIHLSTTAHPPDGLSLTFASNIGADDTLVFTGPLSLSSSRVGPAVGPYAFDIVITLQRPFLYDPAKGHLLLDVKNLSPGETTTVFDFHFAEGDSTSRIGSSSLRGDVNDVDSPTADFADSGGLVTRFTTIPIPSCAAPTLVSVDNTDAFGAYEGIVKSDKRNGDRREVTVNVQPVKLDLPFLPDRPLRLWASIKRIDLDNQAVSLAPNNKDRVGSLLAATSVVGPGLHAS